MKLFNKKFTSSMKSNTTGLLAGNWAKPIHKHAIKCLWS